MASYQTGGSDERVMKGKEDMLEYKGMMFEVREQHLLVEPYTSMVRVDLQESLLTAGERKELTQIVRDNNFRGKVRFQK